MEKELKKITLDLSPHTSKIYANSYKQIRVILNIKDKRKFIKNKPVEDVVETLDNYIVPRTQKKINPNTKYSYFVVVKKIYMNEKNKDFLMEKEKQYRDEVQEYKKQQNGELQKEDLPTFTELSKILKNEEKPMKYLINFLFLKVNVRNQDVAYIKLHKNNVDESKLDNQLNHIYLKDGKAIYLRNKYKTFGTYGQKRNIISVKKFVDVVKELLKNKICGVANGRAEYGPRALGNRSLLGDPRYDIKDTVNTIKKREKFSPFAPAILEEYADEYLSLQTRYEKFLLEIEVYTKDVEDIVGKYLKSNLYKKYKQPVPKSLEQSNKEINEFIKQNFSPDSPLYNFQKGKSKVQLDGKPMSNDIAMLNTDTRDRETIVIITDSIA